MAKYILTVLIVLWGASARADFCWTPPTGTAAYTDGRSNGRTIGSNPGDTMLWATNCTTTTSGQKKWDANNYFGVSTSGGNKYCHCALIYPVLGDWVYAGSFTSTDACLYGCANMCGLKLKNSDATFMNSFYGNLFFMN